MTGPTDLIERIRESGKFDVNWYLEIHHDVKANGIDPISHYVNFGWQESRECPPEFVEISQSPAFKQLLPHRNGGSAINGTKRGLRKFDGKWGANIVGNLRAEDETAGVARSHIHALELVEIPCVGIDFDSYQKCPQRNYSVADRFGPPEHSVSIVHLEPHHLSRFAQEFGELILKDKYVIANWASDTMDFPLFHPHIFECIDEVWVEDSFAQKFLETRVCVPVLTIPLSVSFGIGATSVASVAEKSSTDDLQEQPMREECVELSHSLEVIGNRIAERLNALRRYYALDVEEYQFLDRPATSYSIEEKSVS